MGLSCAKTGFLKLDVLREPFWSHLILHRWVGTYERDLDADQPRVGKDKIHKIESKPITLRTRIKC